jgi:hypothetical protein
MLCHTVVMVREVHRLRLPRILRQLCKWWRRAKRAPPKVMHQLHGHSKYPDHVVALLHLWVFFKVLFLIFLRNEFKFYYFTRPPFIYTVIQQHLLRGGCALYQQWFLQPIASVAKHLSTPTSGPSLLLSLISQVFNRGFCFKRVWWGLYKLTRISVSGKRVWFVLI